MNRSHPETPDVVLIGGGIMSAHVGVLLKCLDPRLRIRVYEAANELASESSNGWNNAGTGHAGICELSYTPTRDGNGAVDVHKAIDIFHDFEQSLQFWAQAVAVGMVEGPQDFIRPVPHVSFVCGAEQTDFLKARHSAMTAHHFFREMQYSDDSEMIGSWAPLLTQGRDQRVPIAATKMDAGTDVNFGALARKLFSWLGHQDGCAIATGRKVVGLNRTGSGWTITSQETATGVEHAVQAKFVFVGAGGGSLLLLQKAGIPEVRGVGGFPIGGNWLVCDRAEIVAKHRAKVYGYPLGAAPTMAAPHLDIRIIEGKKALLFGPFAAGTSRFLRDSGSWADLWRSVKAHNIVTLLRIGATNLPLLRYLIAQSTQSMADRMEALRYFYPNAKEEDWRLRDAGIRVQTIKKTGGEAGIVHYGTEILTSEDRSISALLGASPGASVCVAIALQVIETSFPNLIRGEQAMRRVQSLIPTFGVDLRQPEHAEFYRQSHDHASHLLGVTK